MNSIFNPEIILTVFIYGILIAIPLMLIDWHDFYLILKYLRFFSKKEHKNVRRRLTKNQYRYY